MSGQSFIVYIILWITMVTTIQLRPETKSRLDALKLHPRESYDEMLNRLLDMAYDPEPLSEETLQQIEEGIRDIRAGRYRSLTDIAEELGLE
jgi:predicted transcriptional regulator